MIYMAELIIKKLVHQSKVIVPQTVAEAVLVKEGDSAVLLPTVLDRKLEQIITPAGSGLSSYRQGNNVYITHESSIAPNESATVNKIKYDSRGHIVETSEPSSMIITLNNKTIVDYNGNSDQGINFGDDFTMGDNQLILQWLY